MRQMGHPPAIDVDMTRMVQEVFREEGFDAIDADGSTGDKDFLARILGLIRATGATVAIFSHETRGSAMANIALELGFAAMCGKPLVIVKSAQAAAPSDLTRTDWVVYDAQDEMRFKNKLRQAARELTALADYEDMLLNAALDARSMDFAVAFERANKGFLITGEKSFVDAAARIQKRLDAVKEGTSINDLERLRTEISVFIRQARRVLR